MFLILLTASLAHAQDAFVGGDVPPINVQNFQVALDSQNFLWMTESTMMRDGAFSYRATESYHTSLFGYEANDRLECYCIVNSYRHFTDRSFTAASSSDFLYFGC